MNKEKIRKKFDEYKEKKQSILLNNQKIKNLQIRKAIRPLLRFVLCVQRNINRQQVEFINQDIDKTDKKTTIVYAVSHIGKWDFEIVNEQIKDHFYIIASDFMNMYGNINGIFMESNGVIFVDIDDHFDKKNSEKMMLKILEQKDNMMIFPEGTWNLSENQIIMDTHLGAVSIALETNSIIIPISIEQYGKRFVINIGKKYNPSIICNKYTNKEYSDLNNNQEDYQLKKKIKLEANTELRDILATLKYEIWDREPITKRENIPYDYWKQFIEDRKQEWLGYSMDEQIKNGCFPPAKKEYNDMLTEITKMKINKNNEFLFMPKEEFIKKYGHR